MFAVRGHRRRLVVLVLLGVLGPAAGGACASTPIQNADKADLTPIETTTTTLDPQTAALCESLTTYNRLQPVIARSSGSAATDSYRELVAVTEELKTLLPELADDLDLVTKNVNKVSVRKAKLTDPELQAHRQAGGRITALQRTRCKS
jgi:hypothetical protein